MPFDRGVSILPVRIADIAIELFDPDPTTTQNQAATVRVQIVLNNGQVTMRHFNLVDHVPAATITQLQALAASLRQKAVAEILPLPVVP